jgi:hypothetical protein
MAFNIPINSIAPHPTPADWVRPVDWITITDVANEVQFLVADTGLKAFAIETTFTQNSGANIYIDWGDGVIDTITIPTVQTTNHVYSTGGTPCSRGYNTFKIRIYGDATCVITNVKHVPNFSVTGGNPSYSVGVLEAYFGDGTMEEISQSLFSSIGGINSFASFTELEYVKLPAVVTWTTQMQYMFQNCVNLHKVVMPTSASSLVTLVSTFNGCVNLLDITLPLNATSIASLQTTFSSCRSLRTVSFPTTLNSVTALQAAFSNCISLKNVTLPSINICIDLGSIFQLCQSLQWVRFTSFPVFSSGLTAVNAASMFSQCSSLQHVYFPSECSSTAFYNISSAFNSCFNLKNIVFPINFNANTLVNTFSNCNSLISVIFQSPMPNLTMMDQTFQTCYLLTSVTLPVTVGASVSMQSTFNSCYALKSITIPSAWTLGALNNAFNNCISLKTVVLPNNTQDSITTMLGTFNNCYKLESITLPTSLTSVNTLQNTFSNCIRISSVVFPASMPSLTTMANTFLNCFNLTSLTLPISTTSLTSAALAFTNCIKIETITLPTTAGAISSFQQTFLGCTNLKTITLPTTQMIAINTISNMLTQCGVLTTVNNLDKIGSLVATPLVNGSFFTSQTYALTSLSFNCPFSQLAVNGSFNSRFNKLNSLRLLNTSIGQWVGSSPQINVSYCDLGIAALDQLFTDLTTVTSKTINITGCTGAAGCTRSIATAKGWTVTG